MIGSSDVWNSELDRIQRFHDQFGTTAEEMETASAAQIAGLFQIPFLGIRVVSNNITNGEPYDTRTGEACQDYVYEVVKAYVGGKVEGPLSGYAARGENIAAIRSSSEKGANRSSLHFLQIGGVRVDDQRLADRDRSA